MHRIELDDLRRPEVLALIEEHLRNMHEVSPPGNVFAFDVDKLRAPDVETGSHPAFLPAQALYRSVGFSNCGPFGTYCQNDFSVFMSLSLEPGGSQR
jgi:hypothetical protein